MAVPNKNRHSIRDGKMMQHCDLGQLSTLDSPNQYRYSPSVLICDGPCEVISPHCKRCRPTATLRFSTPLMLSRIIVPVLATAVLVFACGPRAQSPMSGTRPSASAGKGVTSHVMVDTARGNVRFAIEVANDSRKRVELNFPDGRTHDFMVLDARGKEVWRWSQGRLFTQAMQNRLLDAHDAIVYAERWTPPAPGQYTLVAQLNSENYPVQQRVEFALR